MDRYGKYVGLVISIALFLIVVPYSVYEWFDDRIPFSPVLYLFSAISIIIVAYNIYSFKRND